MTKIYESCAPSITKIVLKIKYRSNIVAMVNLKIIQIAIVFVKLKPLTYSRMDFGKKKNISK